MENEKFQDLVLGHLAKLTQDFTELKTGQQGLLQDVSELKTGQDRIETQVERIETQVGGIETRVDQIEIRVGRIEPRFERIESKLDLVYNHTAKLTEDIAVIGVDVKFLKYKEARNEEDLFKLKSDLKLIK